MTEVTEALHNPHAPEDEFHESNKIKVKYLKY